MTTTQDAKVHSMTGNEIVARAAVAAGCRFYAGYPISPSSEIAAFMAALLPPRKGAFIQMEDEIASMAAIIGASLTGKKVMTATSGPGYSLKQENLGLACMAEVPCVVVNVMRSGPSTGMPTLTSQGDVMQAKWGTHGDHPIIALAPSYHDEIYTETVRAFNMADKYRTPVILLTDETLAQMTGRVNIPDEASLQIENRPRPTCEPKDYLPFDDSQSDVPPMADFFSGYHYHVTGLTHSPNGSPTENTTIAKKLFDRQFRKLNANLDDILKYECYRLEDADTVVVAYGSAALPTKQAIDIARDELGMKVGLFRPVTIWPFPEEPLKKVASDANGKPRRMIVAEGNMGQVALEVERLLHRPIEKVLRYNGELMMVDDILGQLEDENAAAESSVSGR